MRMGAKVRWSALALAGAAVCSAGGAWAATSFDDVGGTNVHADAIEWAQARPATRRWPSA